VSWDPTQYERFHDERSLPFFDLLALIEPRPGMRAVDLGCGTGELTRVLHERLGCASTVGYDGSAEMLEKERARPAAPPGLSFAQARVEDLSLPKGSVDLVFANASLHWVADHRALFARLAGWLAPGGQLAVQVPHNHDYATHVLARELAQSPRFAARLDGYVPPIHVLEPRDYALLLSDVGFRPTRIRMEVYTHLLPSSEGVFEWVRGSLLTSFRARLDASDYEAFEREYRLELLARLPNNRPFIYPFQRTLVWGKLDATH
jgi:trans-aconitate 2-methyltransferase